ncbi:sialate O-acetylesterase [candidate division KSB1 bacterium]|nr:sialate O-acetylesterase [candidate division KSB1 bacterium]
MNRRAACIAISLWGMAIGGAFEGHFPETRNDDSMLQTIRSKADSPTARGSFPPMTLKDARDDIPVKDHGKLSLFILAGQSNMSGRGEYIPDQPPNPRIFLFGNDYHWKLAAEPIDDSENQVDEISIDSNPGFSLGLAFATSLLSEEPDLVIGLIPCAKGGSSIEQWQRNLSDKSLYGSCLKRARAASVMGEIAGLLFFQGESDALDPIQYPQKAPAASNYAAKFSAFVTEIRRDLCLPELPVVFAQIGNTKKPDIHINWKLVKEQQASVNLPRCTMVTTDDLPLKDAVHFTTESYKIIGKRFADAFLRLAFPKK